MAYYFSAKILVYVVFYSYIISVWRFGCIYCFYRYISSVWRFGIIYCFYRYIIPVWRFRFLHYCQWRGYTLFFWFCYDLTGMISNIQLVNVMSSFWRSIIVACFFRVCLSKFWIITKQNSCLFFEDLLIEILKYETKIPGFVANYIWQLHHPFSYMILFLY